MPTPVLNGCTFLETIIASAVLVFIVGGIGFYIIGPKEYKKASLIMSIVGVLILIILAAFDYMFGYNHVHFYNFINNVLVPAVFYILGILIGAVIGGLAYILMILK
ncbi:MAG: hypothetical protein ACP5LM_03555 [Thermoplasmata archaeon]